MNAEMLEWGELETFNPEIDIPRWELSLRRQPTEYLRSARAELERSLAREFRLGGNIEFHLAADKEELAVINDELHLRKEN